MGVSFAKISSVSEKAHYPFWNYPRKQCDTVLFPGCSLPSQFPRTMDALASLCREAGIGVAYDCCGKPLDGFGYDAGARRIVEKVNRRLERVGCKRVIFACPNCRDYLKGKLRCESASVFDLFDELGVEQVGEFSRGRLFIPCPDKKNRQVENKIRAKNDLSAVVTLNRSGCCGLRPDIANEGAEFASKHGKRVIEQSEGETIYTYCASCLGQFSRLGCNECRHVISVVLGIDELPDSGHAFVNRAKRKFDRKVDAIGTDNGMLSDEEREGAHA